MLLQIEVKIIFALWLSSIAKIPIVSVGVPDGKSIDIDAEGDYSDGVWR